ncbi:response regulator [Actinoplanes sp. URMC 104]|uniref:response regulator n=1 Tax=Actinoplanes sp. URMC 104 TaxID=3423409 RepID=UPI003F1DD89E
MGGTLAAGPAPDGGFTVRAGLTALEHLATLPSPPRVVALTTFDLDEYVVRALQSGAVGFLLKSTPPDELADLVRVAAAGHTVLSPVAAQRLLGDTADRRGARDRAGLRPRS